MLDHDLSGRFHHANFNMQASRRPHVNESIKQKEIDFST